MFRVLTASGLAAAAGLVALTGATVPAHAFDDRPSTFAPIIGIISGGDDEKADIDFRERPPLVVPKQLDLPQPRPGATGARAANWPQDQEVVRRRDEAARARVPTQIEVNRNPALDKNALLAGRSDAAPVAVDMCDRYTNGLPDCAPTSMEKLKRVFSIGDANKDVVIVGKEPTREYLTEPPRGYRTATKTTAVTKDGGYTREDPADAGKYYRDLQKRNSDYR